MMVVEELKTEEKVDNIDDYFLKRDKIKTSNRFKGIIWSKQGRGKSFFALSCPEPVYVICTEPDSVAPLLVHFPDKDIRIMECSMPYSDAPVYKKTGKVDTKPVPNDPELALAKLKKATELLKDVKEGTIVLDSVSDVWEHFTAWIDYNADKYTKSGQMMRTEWGKVNSQYKTLINRLQSRPVHFVMTARSENVYNEEGKETTKEKMSGQKRTPYIPNIIIHLFEKPKSVIGPDKKVVTKSVIFGKILKARGLNESAMDIEIERPTFEKLVNALKEHGGNFE